MITLLPRLIAPAAEHLLAELADYDPINWPAVDVTDLPNGVRYASTGGVRATPVQLQSVRDAVVGIATEFGFPAARPDTNIFDSEVTSWIAEAQLFDSGEALRDDVWSFVGTFLLSDVVRWRFGSSRERYLGGVRNMFQRLWLRSRALDRGIHHEDRWGIVRELTEDALVQITERPSIAGDATLARELGEAWIRAAEKFGRGAMENKMRQVTLRVRVMNEVRRLSSLENGQLRGLLDSLFAKEGEQNISGSK